MACRARARRILACHEAVISVTLPKPQTSSAKADGRLTMESWNSTWVPTYRLIAGPVRHPERHELRQMIQEDIDDQRAILQKLRNKMN